MVVFMRFIRFSIPEIAHEIQLPWQGFRVADVVKFLICDRLFGGVGFPISIQKLGRGIVAWQ